VLQALEQEHTAQSCTASFRLLSPSLEAPVGQGAREDIGRIGRQQVPYRPSPTSAIRGLHSPPQTIVNCGTLELVHTDTTQQHTLPVVAGGNPALTQKVLA
jgi:hypothetical protein